MENERPSCSYLDDPASSNKESSTAVDKQMLKNVNQTKLYLPLTYSQWPIVYHSVYNIGFFGMENLHPFDAKKWGKIYQFLKDAKMITDETVIQPKEAEQSDLLVVHTQRYLNSLKWSGVVAAIMEVPPVALLPNCIVQKKALKPFRLHTGGTVLAAELALQRGWSINLGGGFHHCSASRGGGFCCYADITLALQFLFVRQRIRSAMIVDLDAHQGNGHERDFVGDRRVYIMDMFNASIYPFDQKAKAGISRKVELRSFTNDDNYLALLEKNLTEALTEFHPDILLYNAGTDCLSGDPLGCLSISPKGIISRDEIVFRLARSRQIPVVMVTSGGYQRTNARIIADSILNLLSKNLISAPPG